MEYIAWIQENWGSIVIIITSVVTAASVIAKLTPTEVDDNWVGKIIKLMDFLAINNKPTETKK